MTGKKTFRPKYTDISYVTKQLQQSTLYHLLSDLQPLIVIKF